MGRKTLSFRMLFQREHANLRQFKEALMDTGRRDAFDSIVKAWSSEMGAMKYSRIPAVLDTMHLTAITDNRKELLRLTKSLKKSNAKLKDMEKDLESF